MLETSIFLAKVIGLVSVISCTAILVNYKKAIAFEQEAVKNLLSTYISGFIFLIIGVLILVSHSVWVLDWRLLITIIGWAILLKSIGRILFPEKVRLMVGKKATNRWFMFGEIFLLLIGIYLLYYGFIIY